MKHRFLTMLAHGVLALLVAVWQPDGQAQTAALHKAPSPPGAGSAEVQHLIVPGDTLIAIAAEYLNEPSEWPALQRLNQVRNPRQLVPGSSLRIPVAWLRRGEFNAEVLFVQGECQWLPAGAKTAVPLAVGKVVQANDVLRTGPAASLTLRFSDGSRLLVMPDSEMQVEQLFVYGRDAAPNVQLRLNKGHAESHVVPRPDGKTRFEIVTPTIHLGVRGTRFRTRLDAQGTGTLIEVQQGRVLVAGTTQVAAAAVPLGAGQGLAAQAGQALPAPQALSAAPDLSAMPARIEQWPLRLAWPALADTKHYRVQVLAADAEDRLMLDGIFEGPAAQWPDQAALPDGNYRLRVRGLSAQRLEGLDAEAPFSLLARPEPPFLRLPLGGSTSRGDQARFAWTQAIAAARYRLQVASGADFAQPMLDLRDLEAAEVSAPLPPGQYRWRVASIAADGHQGPFGEAQAFVQMAEPPSAVALAAAEVTDTGIVFRWREPAAGEKVQFQVSGSVDFEPLLVDQTTDQAVGRFEPPGPGSYFLRARTLGADGSVGPFSEVQKVEVAGTNWWWILPVGVLLLILP